MKYNTKLVWDYINGEEVPNIDDLESDYKFMIEVLRVTNDKKMYNLCSDEMKNNYEFIKSVIEIFIDDKKFIKEIADKYLEKQDEYSLNYQELIFLICDLANIKEFDDDLINYSVKRATIYSKEKVNIEWNLKQENYEFQQELGMGFAYLLYAVYPDSEIILKYFAEKYIDEIFYEQEGLKLEELVHKHFSTFEKLQEIEIKKYILNYIAYKDKYLANYLLSNLNLIDKLERNIMNIGINWNNYNKRNIKMKLLKFEEEAELIIEKYKPSFDLLEAYYHIDNMNLHLPVKLCQCEYIKEYLEEMQEYQNENIINIKDHECFKELVKLANKVFILSEKDGKIENKAFPLVPINKKVPSKEIVINLSKIKRKK